MAKKFNWRAFTSLYIVISFLIMAFSGLILFIAPPGRIANWTSLTIIGLTKAQWQALHTVFTFLFILAAAFHIYFNWRPLMAYLRSRVRQTTHIRKELFASAILVAVLASLTLLEQPPFSSLMELSEELSYAWSAPETEPPVPHAELLTIEQLAVQTGRPVEQLIKNLAGAGIRLNDTSVTLGGLAADHHISPSELYARMITSGVTGGGYGRMTIRELAGQFALPVEECLIRLERKGIKSSADITLRDLADQVGLHPHDILTIIRDS